MDDLISSVYRSATLQFPSCYFSFDVIQWSWQKAKAGSVGRHLNWWVTRTVLNFNVTNKGGEERKKKKNLEGGAEVNAFYRTGKSYPAQPFLFFAWQQHMNQGLEAKKRQAAERWQPLQNIQLQRWKAAPRLSFPPVLVQLWKSRTFVQLFKRPWQLSETGIMCIWNGNPWEAF